jgi:hypothetical protein
VCTQGHSKNPAGNDGDRFGTILAEVLASFGHRKASGSDQRQHEVADCGERTAAGTHTAAVLIYRHVADPMEPVFDRPVVPLQLEQSRRAGLGRGEAGDEIGDLGAGLVADPA